MNLINFLKHVDTLTEQYSLEQIRAFIHDIGRMLPESQREEFLERLKVIREPSDENMDEYENRKQEFNKAYQKIKNNLRKIDSQEVTITGILNEDYDEWNGISEEFYYEDENAISVMLAEACEFIHKCMDEKMYSEGSEVGRQLFSMEILCLSEYGDEEFSIGDMAYHNLLGCDLEQVILDTLYCVYHAALLKKRPEALYEIMVNANKKVSIESMMQHGDKELPDFSDFLPMWITYLGDKKSDVAYCLCLEAVSLLNDVSAACEYAEKYADTHPGLYLHILENERSADLKTLVSIGIHAMNVIPKNYVVRSKVALKTASYIAESEEQLDLLEKCYFTAYESDTSAINYIRALLNGYGTEKKREELRNKIMALLVADNRISYGTDEWRNLQSERGTNNPDRNSILLLRFFDGQFTEVLREGLNKREALGWTGTFMKQGIALYLLYLYEGKLMNKGIATMANIVKREMKGLIQPSDDDGEDLFHTFFSQWKSMTEMKEDIKTGAIRIIEDLIEKRTEGIMNANRRNYYGECAAYIAALGEVKESLGEKDAKQRLMTSYKDKYSRRSAFRAEMKDYGWNDVSFK